MTGARGFALIAVLWVVVALGGLALTATSRAQVSAAAAAARIATMRGRWAAEACLAAAQSRLDARAVAGVMTAALAPDSINLADGSRCAVTMVDSTERPARARVPQRPVARLQLTATGWIPGHAGSSAARIDVLAVVAGTRVAPVRRRVW